MKRCIYLSLLFHLLWSCHPRPNEAVTRQLTRIDTLLSINPEAARDTLEAINPLLLRQPNRAYYHLLQTIATDKLYQSFYSDSHISAAVDYYEKQPLSDNYLRALLYQGIVRLHLELPDSMVYEPLKKAESILLEHPKAASLHTATRIFFYLGRVNQDNNNFEQAGFYYGEAVRYAQKAGDNEGVVAGLLAMFWGYLRQNDFENALSLLNRLDEMKNISPELQFDIINAHGGYFLTKGEYNKALMAYKQLEKLTNQLKGKPLLSHLYYSIAKIYGRIDELDSALYYAQKATENIADTSFQSKNYYLHTYLADMAQQEGKYELAATHYKEAFGLLLKSVDEKTEKRIYELEKKYDLSRVEVNALRARQRHQGMMVAMTVGILVLLLLLYTFKQRLRHKHLVLENQRLKLQALEEEYRYNQYAKQQSENLVAIYRLLARGQTDVRDRFERLSMKYINKNQAFYEALQAVLTFLKDEFTAQMEELANSGVLDMYKIPDTIELSATEKIILFLIYCQTTAKENATLLGISANNYGVKKWHLKQKLSPYATKSEDIKEVLSRFEAQNPPKSH